MYDEIDTAEFQVDFRKHLEEASQEVSTWPAWKQSVLGKALENTEGCFPSASTETQPVNDPSSNEA